MQGLSLDATRSRLYATLFWTISVSTVVGSWVAALHLKQSVGVGRVRDLGICWLVRRVGLAFDADLTLDLPVFLSRPHALTDWLGLLNFWFLALSTNLGVAFMVGAAVTPMMLLMWKKLPGHFSSSQLSWFWGRAFPVGIFVAFLAPYSIRPFSQTFIAGYRLGEIFALAAQPLIWFCLFRAMATPNQVDRVLRWSRLGSAALCVTAIVTAACLSVTNPGNDRVVTAGPESPNILLVSIDSLRADHLHCYGYPRSTSPTIDGLAADGVRFNTVVAPTSWTLPSQATLLTSLEPDLHGVNLPRERLSPDAVLLPDVLRGHGYTTAGFVSGPFMDASYGFFRGFDLYDDYTAVRRHGRAAATVVTSPLLLDSVESWLSEWDRGGREKPFFIFLHMWDVHYDYLPPPPFDTMFDPAYQGSINGEHIFTSNLLNKNMDPGDLAHVVALYDGEIRFTDAYLGRILGLLQELGIYDSTVVAVTADHGEEFFDHGAMTHGKTLYDEVVLVPWVIRFPVKIPAGRVVERQVRLSDVAPTVLSLAGISQPREFGAGLRPPMDDRPDLVPLILGRSEPARDSFAVGNLRNQTHSIRTKQFKLIRHADGRDELFDLVADPQERSDLSKLRPQVKVVLQNQLAAWKSEADIGGSPERHSGIDQELQDALRSLGYLK